MPVDRRRTYDRVNRRIMTKQMFLPLNSCLLEMYNVYLLPFSQVYIEDAFGDRVWAEFGACKKLIDNINTIFDTRSSSGGGQGQVGVAKSSELGTQLVGLSETKGEDISEDAEEMEEEKGRGKWF